VQVVSSCCECSSYLEVEHEDTHTQQLPCYSWKSGRAYSGVPQVGSIYDHEAYRLQRIAWERDSQAKTRIRRLLVDLENARKMESDVTMGQVMAVLEENLCEDVVCSIRRTVELSRKQTASRDPVLCFYHKLAALVTST
jgi:hypothetical protein